MMSVVITDPLLSFDRPKLKSHFRSCIMAQMSGWHKAQELGRFKDAQMNFASDFCDTSWKFKDLNIFSPFTKP